MTKIKELPKEERPIERLVENGVNSLSNEELLAILLKSGTKNCSSKQLAENLIKKAGGVQGLKNLPFSQLLEEKGMGTVEVILIIVVLIGLVIIFKKQLRTLVTNVFKKITEDSNTVMS